MLTETHQHLYSKLYRDLGEIVGWIEDEEVNEIMPDPDGQLWIDGPKRGQCCVGSISSAQV